MHDLTFIYNKLKTTYNLILTDTLALDCGYTVNVPVIRGTAPDRHFDLYKDEGMFVLSTAILDENGVEAYDHRHPLDAKDAIAAIRHFMPPYTAAHGQCMENTAD